MSDEKFKFPTEVVELPSKGLVYPEDNPLAEGKIVMKYMTAKEEDILTNQNYIKNGTVIDELLKSLIVSKINYNDLIVGDKNAIMIAARILGYGKEYSFKYNDEEVMIDLSELNHVVFDKSQYTKGKNEFSFTLPTTGVTLTYKLLNHGDEAQIDKEVKGLKRLNKNASPEVSTRLKHMITSVNEENDRKSIRDFVDDHFLARDTRAFREHLKTTQPDVDLTFFPENGEGDQVTIPINLNFFWPDAQI